VPPQSSILDLQSSMFNPRSWSPRRDLNSDSPAPKAGGFPTSLDPEWLRRQDSNLRIARLTTGCLTSLATPHQSGSSRRNRTVALTLMRGALCRLSYRAAILGGPRGSRTHYPSIKSRELILMSFRPKWSRRDSNSDHAVICRLQGIRLPLYR
jgi:hypothetical protein